LSNTPISLFAKTKGKEKGKSNSRRRLRENFFRRVHMMRCSRLLMPFAALHTTLQVVAPAYAFPAEAAPRLSRKSSIDSVPRNDATPAKADLATEAAAPSNP
jgi:hypothetical protein